LITLLKRDLLEIGLRREEIFQEISHWLALDN